MYRYGRNTLVFADDVRLYLEQLGYHTRNCKELLKSVSHIEDLLQEIETQYHIVAKKTDELHQTCEGLVLEEVSQIPTWLTTPETNEYGGR